MSYLVKSNFDAGSVQGKAGETLPSLGLDPVVISQLILSGCVIELQEAVELAEVEQPKPETKKNKKGK